MRMYAGLDWASVEHAVCVVDERGVVIERIKIEHTTEGLRKLVVALQRLGGDAPIAVAIERPTGLVVDTLVEAGLPVVPIHPNVVKASRSRYTSSGAKSDPGDAYLLADLLRTDGHRFRPLEPLSDEIRALRAKVRTRDDLVATRVQLANQLRSLLEEFWPGAAAIFSSVDSAIAMAFLEEYPTPGHAAELDKKGLATFLVEHSYRGRRPAAQLLERLRSAPVGLAGAVETESKQVAALALVAVLRPLVEQIHKLTTAIEHDVEKLPVGKIMMSFPRAGRVNAAQIVAELGEAPSRFVDADHLAAEAGVVPVTKSSGKHRTVAYRFACNKRLRNAITCWADNSRHSSEWAAAIYRRARARGCDHPHAVRILARSWCRILWRCWRDGLDYDEKKHAGAVALLQPMNPHPDDEAA